MKNLNDQVALWSDGTLRLNLQKLGTPHDQYDADLAWIEKSLGWVRLHFAQVGPGPRLRSEVTVKYSPEAFFAHFWTNSRSFHEGLRARRAAGGMVADPARDKFPLQGGAAEKTHTLTANYDILAHAGSEASIDFFHLPPSALAAWTRQKDASGLKVSPMLRVLLSTDELVRLLDEAEPLARELEPKVASILGGRDG